MPHSTPRPDTGANTVCRTVPTPPAMPTQSMPCGQHLVWPAPPWRTHYSEIDRIEMTTLQPSGRLPQGSLVPDRTGFSPSVFRFFAEFPQRKPNYLGNFHPFRCKQGTYPKSRRCIILQLARTILQLARIILQLARIILQLSCIILQLYPPFPREITPSTPPAEAEKPPKKFPPSRFLTKGECVMKQDQFERGEDNPLATTGSVDRGKCRSPYRCKSPARLAVQDPSVPTQNPTRSRSDSAPGASRPRIARFPPRDSVR